MRSLILLIFFLFEAYTSGLVFGQNWSALGIGFDASCNALAVDANGNVYAGGYFEKALTSFGDVKEVNYVARWNGSEWLPLGKGVDGPVHVLAVDKSNRYIYVGGDFSNAYNSNGVFISTPNIARWDKLTGTWSALGSGLDGKCTAILVDDENNRIYAGGSYSKAGGVNANNIAYWDGSKWNALGLGLNSYCRAIAMDNEGNIFAGGRFTNAGGISAVGVAKWDGSVWSPLGSGLFGAYQLCFAMTFDKNEGNLYVGGIFTKAGDVDSKHIAMWDGSSWQALGNGLSRFVYDMAADENSNIYIAGWFNQIEGTTIRMPFVTYWNGNWNAMSEGVDTNTNALALGPDGSVYVGGEFGIAGGVEARYIARWTPAWAGSQTALNSEKEIRLYPQPAGDYLRIDLQDAFHGSDELTLTVMAADGRMLLTRQLSGSRVYPLPIPDLPQGLYLLQLRSNKMQVTRTFLKQ